LAGRAVGNLRQPNHVASLLLWSSIALVALVELGRLRPRWAWPALALLMWAVVLTASRTGMVGAVLLALWALADRRLSRAGRALALSAPAWYALAWVGMAEWARQAHQSFGGTARMGESVEGSSRMGIWRDTLALIGEHPWWGVGFGEFNFAWSLTPFPNRPVAFFDHTHNLLLQFAVELGLPLTAMLMAILAWELWRAARRAWGAGNARWVLAPGAPRAAPASAPARMALAMVAMIGLHSLLEYPLWYAYFLLPAAWCLGAALAAPGADAWRETAARQAPPEVPQEGAPGVAHGVPRPGRAALQLGGAALVLGALGAVADYARVVPIFEAGEGAAPLAQRIAAGQHSLLFAHHAHYAAATVSATPAQELPSLQQAAHHLLDTRLMMAWARAYADAGDLERARFLAARLREFRNPASAELFEPCAAAGPGAAPATRREAVLADQPEPFACTADSGTLGWRDFLPPGDPRAASAARGR
ncbi:MAG: Wzy polymerase domain-containing protein, partial [Rubrivivax sp.]